MAGIERGRGSSATGRREAGEGRRPRNGELDGWLRRNHEPLMRRWLEYVVESASLEELSSRPLADWAQELGARLERGAAEAVLGPAAGEPDAPVPRPEALRALAAARAAEVRAEEELARQLAAYNGTRRPLSVALLGTFDGAAEDGRPGLGEWTVALRRARGLEGPGLFPAGGEAVALLLPRTGPAAARAEVDRLRVGAWRLLGQRGPLAEVGLAAHPHDGASASAVLEAARRRMARAWVRANGP